MKLGVLNAYHFDRDPKSYRAQYRPMCLRYLENHFPPNKVSIFEVGQGEFPGSIGECDAWLITGSSKGAYDNDPWISELSHFIAGCHQFERKMIGVCFGHQLIAQALGGAVEKSLNGWGVGVREFTIYKNAPWMRPALNTCSLLFSHQDQVSRLPDNAEHLAGDSFCKYQMYSIGKHIFCLQGHPEFSVDFARSRYDDRKTLLGQETYESAKESLSKSTDAHVVGTWIKNFVNG